MKPMLLALVLTASALAKNAAVEDSIFRDPVFQSVLDESTAPLAVNGSCGVFVGLADDPRGQSNALQESIEAHNPRCAMSLAWSFYQSVPWWDEAAVQRDAHSAAVASFNAGNVLVSHGYPNFASVPYELPQRDTLLTLLFARKAFTRAVRAASLFSTDSEVLDECISALTNINDIILKYERAIFESQGDGRTYVHDMLERGELSGGTLTAIGDDSFLQLTDNDPAQPSPCCGSINLLRDSLLRVRFGDAARAIRSVTPDCFWSSASDDSSERLEACAVLALAATKAADIEFGRDMVQAVWHPSTIWGGTSDFVTHPPDSAAEAANRIQHFLGAAKSAALELERFRNHNEQEVDIIIEQIVSAVQRRVDRTRLSQHELYNTPKQIPAAPRAIEENLSSTLVGLFVLRGPDRAFVSESPGPALALSVRSLWFERPDLRLSLKVHVLVDFLPVAASIEEDRWKHALGDEVSVCF